MTTEVKILIDLNSIEENPRAGETVSHVPGRKEQRITSQGIEASQEAIPVYHYPLPKYNFKYVPTKVKCIECGAEFMDRELIYEDDMLGNQCPDCGAWDCVELEYETIEEALARKNCPVCNGDGNIMKSTGDPQHPVKAVKCPRCSYDDGRKK